MYLISIEKLCKASDKVKESKQMIVTKEEYDVIRRVLESFENKQSHYELVVLNEDIA
ncbi:hypothetical protein OMM_03946 [Acetobacter orientalis]|uniref:Uncharacterized protein n=1 Tax=Acetobacter orientalis TaxID=146474 RepID=A0A2Z5ZIN6_9PROT|nr:hypothetical protein OMM_03946 [Acetobacter orientalis]